MLLRDDDAAVVPTCSYCFVVKPAKIGGVVSQEHTVFLGGPGELRRIIGLTQTRLTGRRYIHSAIAQSTHQGMGLGIFIQVESRFTHTATLLAAAVARTARSSAM